MAIPGGTDHTYAAAAADVQVQREVCLLQRRPKNVPGGVADVGIAVRLGIEIYAADLPGDGRAPGETLSPPEPGPSMGAEPGK